MQKRISFQIGAVLKRKQAKWKMAVIPNTSKEKVFHFPRIDTKARR